MLVRAPAVRARSAHLALCLVCGEGLLISGSGNELVLSSVVLVLSFLLGVGLVSLHWMCSFSYHVVSGAIRAGCFHCTPCVPRGSSLFRAGPSHTVMRVAVPRVHGPGRVGFCCSSLVGVVLADCFADSVVARLADCPVDPEVGPILTVLCLVVLST